MFQFKFKYIVFCFHCDWFVYFILYFLFLLLLFHFYCSRKKKRFSLLKYFFYIFFSNIFIWYLGLWWNISESRVRAIWLMLLVVRQIGVPFAEAVVAWLAYDSFTFWTLNEQHACRLTGIPCGWIVNPLWIQTNSQSLNASIL